VPWPDIATRFSGRFNTFGDELRVSTVHGDLRYEVRETMVVGPNDLWVLDPTDRPTLTLITCYPFGYVGKAPRRFIVRAERTTSTARSNRTSNALSEVQEPWGQSLA
jgi:LPXTG-site transpeptidase (sortase) family protein